MAMNEMTAVGLIAVAAALFKFAFAELHKKKRRKTFFAVSALLLSLGYFAWLILVHGAQASAMLAVVSWKYLVIGVLMLAAGCYLLFGPKARRRPQIAMRLLSLGVMLILMGFGLIAHFLWQALPAAKILFLG